MNLLGGAAAIHKATYSRVTVNDGSTVPGVPPLENGEAKKLLFDKIKAKGMGDGFSEFIQEIAIQNPTFMEVEVSVEANWTDLEKILGETTKPHGLANARSNQMDWHGTGDVDKGDWLSFGVSNGKVRYVRASFPMMDFRSPWSGGAPLLVAAESVPGGRSAPNPDKAFKKFKPRPQNAEPREVEALEKLGVVSDIKPILFEGKRPGVRLDGVNETAQEALGKPLYPDLLTVARKYPRAQINQLLVTTSKSISLDELTDIMNDTTLRTDDAKTFPGLTVRWYRYNWIEFGIVDGNVKKVRISLFAIPKKL